MNDVIYQYDGSLDGFLCCVYESYVYKEAPAAFCCDEDPLSLYEVRTVITQPAYSQRVSRGIAARSGKALAVVRRSFLTCLPDKEARLYAFIRKLLAEGPGFMRDLSDPACYPLYRAIRHMNGELENCAVCAVSDYGGTLGAEIEPKTVCCRCCAAIFASVTPTSSFLSTTAPIGNCCCTPTVDPALRRSRTSSPRCPERTSCTFARCGSSFPKRRHSGARKSPVPEHVYTETVSGDHDGVFAFGIRKRAGRLAEAAGCLRNGRLRDRYRESVSPFRYEGTPIPPITG